VSNQPTVIGFLEAAALNKDLDIPTRLRAASIVAQYLYPKLQAVAHLHAGELGDRLDNARKKAKELEQARREGRLIEHIRTSLPEEEGQ
jgi:hypothetical protein